tara:strand:- start:5 stop:769 length:765 start_codon:yes stop_codon:yes gene_type:complete
MILIDTHAHLYYDSMYDRLDDVIGDAAENHVHKIVCIGTDVASSKQSVDIANQYEGVYAAVGVHPHDSNDVDGNYIKELEHLASSSKKVVAIGEIGIDHYRNLSPPDVQRKVMIEQMELANSLNLPIIFHNRDADDEIFNVLKEHSFNRALSHCFSSDIVFAKQLVDLNILLSFSGNVTFKNSSNRSAAENIGLDNFVLETDCPFLSPHPFRGKPNEPKRVYDIALYLSDLLGISIEEIADTTSKNAMQFFNID